MPDVKRGRCCGVGGMNWSGKVRLLLEGRVRDAARWHGERTCRRRVGAKDRHGLYGRVSRRRRACSRVLHGSRRTEAFEQEDERARDGDIAGALFELASQSHCRRRRLSMCLRQGSSNGTHFR